MDAHYVLETILTLTHTFCLFPLFFTFFIYCSHCAQGENQGFAKDFQCPLCWCHWVIAGQDCFILAKPQGTQQLVDPHKLAWTVH